MTPDHETIIIGGGQAGLIVADGLRAHGRTFHWIDQTGVVGSAWRCRYDALRLNTLAKHSAVPGHAVPPSLAHWPGGGEWADYLRDVAAEIEADPAPVVVQRVVESDAGWRVETSEGMLAARNVVVATGRAHTPSLPDWPGMDETPFPIEHSNTFKRPEPYAGKHVLVVGAGNSGTEIAHLLVPVAASVTLSAEENPLFFRRRMFGISVTRAGIIAEHLPDRVLDRFGPVGQRALFGKLEEIGLGPPDVLLSKTAETAPTIDAGFIDDVRKGLIELVGEITHFADNAAVAKTKSGSGTVMVRPDVVIAATGYGTGLPDLVSSCHLDGDGWPLVKEPPFSTAPGLYFAGYAPASLRSFLPDFRRHLPSIAAHIAERAG